MSLEVCRVFSLPRHSLTYLVDRGNLVDGQSARTFSVVNSILLPFSALRNPCYSSYSWFLNCRTVFHLPTREMSNRNRTAKNTASAATLFSALLLYRTCTICSYSRTYFSSIASPAKDASASPRCGRRLSGSIR